MSEECTVSEKDCITALLVYTNNEKAIYKSHKAYELETIEGLIGQHFILKVVYILYGVETECTFFLKTVNTAFKVLYDMSVSIRVYEREDLYYNYLQKEFKDTFLPRYHSPACYLSRPRLFIMEYLGNGGYRTNPKKNMLDIIHCKVALKTLAQFHATTVIYEERKMRGDKDYVRLDKAFPENLEDVFTSKTRNHAQDWLECTIRGLLALIEFLPSSKVSNEEFQNRVLEILQEVNDAEVNDKCRKTILHGDLWSNNFLFRYENGKPVDSKLIDYQTLKYGPISIDVVQMVLTNVRRSLREIHYEELLSYYYHAFINYCEELDYDSTNLLNYKDFMESCNEVKIVTKLQCVADHSITFLIDNTIAQHMETEEGVKEFFFGDRSKSMIKSFQENDLYREVITEDLIELRELIF